MLLCSLASPAQSVDLFIDKTDANGARQIITEYVYCKSGILVKHPLYIALGRLSLEDQTAWSLAILLQETAPLKIPKGGGLLLKLSDETVIQLKQTLSEDATEDRVGKYQPATRSYIYSINGIYDITLQELNEIAQKGVKKIRVETAVGFIDVEYKRDKIGSIIKECYLAITNALKRKSDINAGF